MKQRLPDLNPIPIPTVISDGNSDEDWAAWEDSAGFSDSVSFRQVDFEDSELDQLIIPHAKNNSIPV